MNPKAVCLGHLISAHFMGSNSTSIIQLLDEWEYVKETQVFVYYFVYSAP